MDNPTHSGSLHSQCTKECVLQIEELRLLVILPPCLVINCRNIIQIELYFRLTNCSLKRENCNFIMVFYKENFIKIKASENQKASG